MVNVALIIVTIIVFVLIVAANIYILVYFQHEEDKNTAYFPKAVVVISLTLAMVTILMLPMDVANSRTNGGFPMQILWTIVLITDAVFALGIVPFTIFFYEAEDPEHGRSYQIKEAIKWELITIAIFIVLTVVLWIFIGQAEVPVTRLTGELFDANDETFATCESCTRVASCNICSSILTFRVSFPLYLISMLTFVGMFLFVFFGGIGMAALPMDLINGFRKRPKLVKKEVFEAEKAKIATRSKLLIDKANELKSKFGKSGRPTTRRQRAAYLQFRAQVYLLEEDWDVLQIAYGKGFGPRLWQLISGWALLPLGILSAATSILWVLHLILFVVIFPPPTGFLNSMFIALDNFFGLFGTIAYGIFSFYLLWCVIKGNFKFGLRIPLIMTIHPMKVGGTMMNSFLFNSLLILLASPVVVQFCSKAFALYNRFTGIDVLFNIAVQYLRYVKYVWFFYFWPFMILGVLTLIYLLVFPQDRKRSNKDYTIGLP